MNESFPRFESGRMRALRASRAGLAALLIALPFAGFAPLAHAERADKDKPLNIEADNMTYDDLKQVNIFTGHVVATKGTILIRADRVEVTQDPQGYQYATGTSTGKNLAYFRQKRDGVDEYYEGFAQRAVYDGQKRLLELFDRALLKKSNDEIRSNYISYNAATEVFKAEGRPDTRPAEAGETPLGPRVRGVFQPQPKEDKAQAKDTKETQPKQEKSAKGAAPKASNPLPLKTDDSMSVQSGK